VPADEPPEFSATGNWPGEPRNAGPPTDVPPHTHGAVAPPGVEVAVEPGVSVADGVNPRLSEAEGVAVCEGVDTGDTVAELVVVAVAIVFE